MLTPVMMEHPMSEHERDMPAITAPQKVVIAVIVACLFSPILLVFAVFAMLDDGDQVARAPAALPPDPVVQLTPGEVAWSSCAACHGANGEGNAALHAPRLAGQEDWYLRRQLDSFRSGKRGTQPGDTFGAQMVPLAAGISDEKVLLSHIASLAPGAAVDPGAGDRTRGSAGFALCAACHGEQGDGKPELKAPRIANQHAWYIVQQLENFKSGIRGHEADYPEAIGMHHAAATLANRQAMEDVAAYIATLGASGD